jgi:hypothetical protein
MSAKKMDSHTHILVVNSDGSYAALHVKDKQGNLVQLYPVVVQSDREFEDGNTPGSALTMSSGRGFELSAEGKVEMLCSGQFTTYGAHMFEAMSNEPRGMLHGSIASGSAYTADTVRSSREISSKGSYNSDDEDGYAADDYSDGDDDEMLSQGALTSDASRGGRRAGGGRRGGGGRLQGSQRFGRGWGGGGRGWGLGGGRGWGLGGGRRGWGWGQPQPFWRGPRRAFPRGFGRRPRPGWHRYWYEPYGWIYGPPNLALGLGLGLGGLALGGILGSLAKQNHHGGNALYSNAGIIPLTPYTPSSLIDVADKLYPSTYVHIDDAMPNLKTLSDLPFIQAGNKEELIDELESLRAKCSGQRAKGYEVIPNFDTAEYEWICCADATDNLQPVISRAEQSKALKETVSVSGKLM